MPVMLVAGFLAGLAAWKQMFSGTSVSTAHLLEVAGRKKLAQIGPTFQTM